MVKERLSAGGFLFVFFRSTSRVSNLSFVAGHIVVMVSIRGPLWQKCFIATSYYDVHPKNWWTTRFVIRSQLNYSWSYCEKGVCQPEHLCNIKWKDLCLEIVLTPHSYRSVVTHDQLTNKNDWHTWFVFNTILIRAPCFEQYKHIHFIPAMKNMRDVFKCYLLLTCNLSFQTDVLLFLFILVVGLVVSKHFHITLAPTWDVNSMSRKEKRCRRCLYSTGG